VTRTRRLARNVAWNITGQVVPLIAALVAIPLFIRGLGAERFGILTLVWAAIGYFGLFDFGIGRALTHAVASRLGSGETDDLGRMTWTAVALMFACGVAGGVLVAIATPPLIGHWLNVPPPLQSEGRTAFYLTALALPFSMVIIGFRGVLEAYQDFGLTTLLRVPVGVLMYLAPLAALPFSHSVVPVVAVLLALRVIACALHVGVCVWRYEHLRGDCAIRLPLVLPLVRYGGWMTVSNVVSPIMVNMDRFVIGALLPMTAVAYYVTPYELVSKLTLIPVAVLGVIFPALAEAFTGSRDQVATLVNHSVRLLLTLIFPATLVFVLFANDGLRLWIGPTFAAHGTAVMQWLAVGVLINCVAGQVGYTALQGIGRPDLTARVHLVELPLYLAATWWLVHEVGLVGVAIAWTLRATADAVAMFALAARTMPELRVIARSTFWWLCAATLALGGAAALPNSTVRLIAAVVGLVGSLSLIWLAILRAEERSRIKDWAGIRFFRRAAAAGRE